MAFWTTDSAFRLGWTNGRARGYLSAHEAEALYPDLPIALIPVFLNGADDGARKDRWRLNRPRKEA